MIFLTLGTQKFQFNRLLEKVDELIRENLICDEVVAQIGYSDYIPQNYKYKKFLDKNQYLELVDKADIIITHGGVGSILTANRNGIPVVVVPRLKKYGEHVDNHQLDIVKVFSDSGVIISCENLVDLPLKLEEAKDFGFKEYHKNNINFIARFKKLMDELN